MTRIPHSRIRASVRRSGDGFTLVEVLISVVILSMIAGALAAAFVTSMSSSTNNSQKVHAANDAQLIAAYLVRDAQAAGGSNPNTGLIDPTLGVSVNWVSENAGSDPDAACKDSNASHSLVVRFAWADRLTSTTSHLHLAKYYYAPPAGSVPGQLVRLTCVDGGSGTSQTLGNRIGSSPAAPKATCTPAAACPGLPNLVQLTVSEANNPSNPYTYTLSASLRPETPQVLTTANSPSVPFLALGGGTCSGQAAASGLDVEGNPTMKVFGGVAIDATSGPGCPAVFFAGSYQYQAAGLPQQTSIPDPYASLPIPAGTCPAGGGVNPSPVGGVYQPGLYPQPLPSNASLAPGVFVLCASVPTGLHGTGVLLYLAKGTFNLSGGTTTLTAASSGPYAGVAIWQPASNTAAMSVQGNAGLTLGTATPSVSPPLGSGIYAPAAEIDLAGTADLFIGWIVAKTILVTGNHTVTVGVPPATLPSITYPPPPTLPDGLVGKAYSLQFTATGGSGVNTWSAKPGTLPGGLSMSTSGLLSGNPATSGPFNPIITVTDNLGDVFQQSYGWTIAPLPTVTSTTPSSRGQGATNQTIAINGTNFVSGATVSFSGSGITLNSTSFVSSTKINVNISVAANATTGARNVTVVNPDTGTGTGIGVFTVNPRPTVASPTPSSGGQGAVSWPVTINGSGFVSGATVSFSGPGITLNSTSFVSSSKINVTVSLNPTATTGARDVTVMNPDGGTTTGVGVFTVNAAPTVTLISPSSHAKNVNGLIVTITGTNFVSGAAVSFSGTRITVVSTTVVNSTTTKVTINIANNAATTARDVTVTNGDGGLTTVFGGFTVTP